VDEIGEPEESHQGSCRRAKRAWIQYMAAKQGQESDNEIGGGIEQRTVSEDGQRWDVAGLARSVKG
jgi:hypothetical protein